MNSGPVLVDTCAWIDFFRNESGLFGNGLVTLIETDRAAVTGVVAAELLQGVKTDQERETLDFVFGTVAYLDTEEEDWRDAGETPRQLRRKGVTLPLTDALIAAVARRHGVDVFTIDKHFQHLPVTLYSVP